MHFGVQRFRRQRQSLQSKIVLSLPLLFSYPKLTFLSVPNRQTESQSSSSDDSHVIDLEYREFFSI